MDFSQIVTDGGLYSFFIVFLVAALATDIWRWAGVIAGTKIEEDSEILKWIRAVSNALVAGLIGRMLVFPTGALALAPMSLRLSAFIFGVCVYFACGRHFALGVFSGMLALVTAQLLIT